MGGCKAPITTFIVEPFMPHEQEYYLNIVSERLGSSISFSECGGMEIEENWDKVKTIFLPSDKSLSLDTCAPLVATLPLEVSTLAVQCIFLPPTTSFYCLRTDCLVAMLASRFVPKSPTSYKAPLLFSKVSFLSILSVL